MPTLMPEQYERLVEKLGGADQAVRLLSCSHVALEFGNSDEVSVKAASPRLSIWQTIRVGREPKTYLDYLDVIAKKGIRITQAVRRLLEHSKLPTMVTETELQLVTCSVSDFGFAAGANYETVCTRALSLGFGLCPASVALVLLAEHTEKLPTRGSLVVFSEALLDERDMQCILGIAWNEQKLFLLPQYTYPECIWVPVHRLVFVAPPWLTV